MIGHLVGLGEQFFPSKKEQEFSNIVSNWGTTRLHFLQVSCPTIACQWSGHLFTYDIEEKSHHSGEMAVRALPNVFCLALIRHSFWLLNAPMTFPVLKSLPNNSYKCHFFQCQVEKKVLFDFQKLTSAKEQATHGIQSECMPRSKNFFFTSFSAKKNFDNPYF